jgi:AraC-like DNA-binding protein
MIYYTIKPSAKLADFVQYFWIFEGAAADHEPFELRTPASGFAELLFHYKGIFQEITADQSSEASFSSGIHAQTDRHRRFSITQNFGMIGVRLYPYALHVLFGIPAVEFVNNLPDLFLFLGAEDRSITGQVFDAKDHHERLTIITRFLESRIKQFSKPEVAFAVKEIITGDGAVKLDALVNQCSLSQRQFQRNFKEHTGFSAKTFSRIIRFNALLQKSDFNDQSLTDIALTFGYYDQSHFIQDFKAFSGLNPRAYFLERRMQFQ